MARNGNKTAAERMAIIETNFENMAKDITEIRGSLQRLNDKIEIKNKVDEMHSVLTQGEQPKTALQKFSSTARDVKDIILTIIIFLAFLAVLLKVDFSAVIK